MYSKLKLTNYNDKYLTKINKKAKLKPKLYSKNQQLTYNLDGQLKINNECLTNINDNLEFSECDKMSSQKWTISNNKIHPFTSSTKCVTTDNNDNLYIEKCHTPLFTDTSPEPEQYWNFEQSDHLKSSDYTLPQKNKKTLVLVDSNEPWYLNVDMTEQTQYIKPQHGKFFNKQKTNYQNYADYKIEDFTNVKKKKKYKIDDHIYHYYFDHNWH